MRDNTKYDNISFDLNTKKMREFTNNISSGESHDYSISFEPDSKEFIIDENIKEHINRKRPQKKTFPNELK